MLDHGKRDEPVEDVVIDKDKYLEAARLLYPAPAKGPIPKYPDYTRKAGNDGGRPLTEEAKTSPQTTQRTAEENNSDEEPEG